MKKLLLLAAVWTTCASAQTTVINGLSTSSIASSFPGQLTAQGMGFPGVKITQGGSAGTTSYIYTVVGTDTNGHTRAVTGSTALGNATLSGSNYNVITAAAWPGSSYIQPIGSCDVYRTFGGSSFGKIGVISSCASGGLLNDTGLSGNGVSVPADTSGVISASTHAGPTTANKFPAALWAFGDSFMRGAGAWTPTQQSAFALLAKAIPGGIPAYNKAVDGATADIISITAFTNFAPSPTSPMVSILDGGINDSGYGTTTAWVNNFKEAMGGTEAWLSIPYSARIMGSVATGSNWATDTSYPSYNPGFGANYTLIASPGVPVSTTTNGASKTFSVPYSSSPMVGVTFEVTNSQTGTFTISVDGTLQADLCSGTTTFTSAPCSGTSFTDTTTAFRQEFSVTPNATHTVVITSTNTGKVNVVCVDWLPPSGTPNVNTVFVVSPSATSNAVYKTASAAVAAQMYADGLPIYYVDIVSGYPGVNSTTDVATGATAYCDASQASGHPNSQCGYLHMAQTIYNAEVSNGYVFSGVPVAANAITATGVPSITCTINVTSQTAALSSQTLCGSIPVTGTYRVTYYAAVDRAATSSSALGGTTGLVISYLDGSDFVSRAVTLPEFNQSGAAVTIGTGNTTNTTAAVVSGSTLANMAGANSLTYSFGYSSSGATSMEYHLHIIVESVLTP